jgi:polysaccharide export outer membrane protein
LGNFFLLASILFAQEALRAQTTNASSAVATDDATKESLLIGPADVLHVTVFDVPELEQRVRVTDSGDVSLVLLGDLKVAGMTANQTARLIENKLRAGKFVLRPQVTVNVELSATLSLSILGQVRTPGSYVISTPRTILEAISLAGGLTESASHEVSVQRHTTHEIVRYHYSNNADVALGSPVMVFPGDTVLVPKAGIVYVLGDVGRPGGYVMQNNEAQLSVLQAVAQAGGTNHSAVPSHAKLIRTAPDGTLQTSALSLSDMQKGRKGDIALSPGDIIYVPFSYLRNVAVQASSIVSAATSAAIYTH